MTVTLGKSVMLKDEDVMNHTIKSIQDLLSKMFNRNEISTSMYWFASQHLHRIKVSTITSWEQLDDLIPLDDLPEYWR